MVNSSYTDKRRCDLLYEIEKEENIISKVFEDTNPTAFYNGIQLNLQIDELIWKSDFDKEWEQVKKTYELPTRFWSEFEDDMSDKFRKAVGMGYVDVYYRNPDTITHLTIR